MKTVHTFLAFTLLLILTTSVSAQEATNYYFSKEVNGSFEEVIKKTKDSLKEQGFGIITEIEMDKTLKEKLDDVEMQRYTILGACNPKFAYQTLQVEENIGLFLPCKVLVKEIDENKSEVVMVNPSQLMKMLGNEQLTGIADEVTKRFQLALLAL
jgi:uncharacterized protein (DUF302 family)